MGRGWVRNFSGPRGYKLMGPFLKIVDFLKVIQKDYLRCLTTLWDPYRLPHCSCKSVNLGFFIKVQNKKIYLEKYILRY